MSASPRPQKYPEGSEYRDYDIFEVLPDGVAVWRGCVVGMEGVEQKLRDLARESNNSFFALILVDRSEPVIRRGKSAIY